MVTILGTVIEWYRNPKLIVNSEETSDVYGAQKPAAYTWKELSQEHHEAKKLAVSPHMLGSFGDKLH